MRRKKLVALLVLLTFMVTFACPALGAGFPSFSLPSRPNGSGSSNIGIPSLPSLPSNPSSGNLPSLPGLLPSNPGSGNLPSLPGLLPSNPGSGNLPSLPSLLPSNPGSGNLPSLLDLLPSNPSSGNMPSLLDLLPSNPSSGNVPSLPGLLPSNPNPVFQPTLTYTLTNAQIKQMLSSPAFQDVLNAACIRGLSNINLDQLYAMVDQELVNKLVTALQKNDTATLQKIMPQIVAQLEGEGQQLFTQVAPYVAAYAADYLAGQIAGSDPELKATLTEQIYNVLLPVLLGEIPPGTENITQALIAQGVDPKLAPVLAYGIALITSDNMMQIMANVLSGLLVDLIAKAIGIPLLPSTKAKLVKAITPVVLKILKGVVSLKDYSSLSATFKPALALPPNNLTTTKMEQLLISPAFNNGLVNAYSKGLTGSTASQLSAQVDQQLINKLVTALSNNDTATLEEILPLIVGQLQGNDDLMAKLAPIAANYIADYLAGQIYGSDPAKKAALKQQIYNVLLPVLLGQTPPEIDSIAQALIAQGVDPNFVPILAYGIALLTSDEMLQIVAPAISGLIVDLIAKAIGIPLLPSTKAKLVAALTPVVLKILKDIVSSKDLSSLSAIFKPVLVTPK